LAKIVGLGKYVPDKVLTNSDLEKIVDTSDEWITTRTGIKERHIAHKGLGASHLAYEASKIALKRAGLHANDIDLIIVATITPDTPFPSTACYLQNLLKAHKAACFDISAACAGYVYALTTGWQFIKSGLYKNVLVVGSEVLSTITDWSDRSTCVLFGDGAGAAVLTKSNKDNFLSSYLGGDGNESELLIVPGGGSKHPATEETVKNKLHFIKMRGNSFLECRRIMVKAQSRPGETTWIDEVICYPISRGAHSNCSCERYSFRGTKVYVKYFHVTENVIGLRYSALRRLRNGRIKKTTSLF
jgi:3-oxoacyl-[acyl-carrier-protein] synthase-3